MTITGQALGRIVMVSGLLLLPPAVWAQTSGAIAGIARDTSGAVLPGVTVEAASPSLIEKVRSVVTDAQGLYKIVDLRPGTYSVTFTLPGFSTFRREGVELTTNFTATVNGSLAVGALEETVTVTGAAPTVDVQNVIQQQVFSRDDRNAIPLPSHQGAYAAIIPGATQGAGSRDVGGTQGENSQNFTMHGGRAVDYQQLRDGMFFGTLAAAGNLLSSVNTTSVQEVTVLTAGGVTAESETGGAMVNIVPRDGGNVFGGSVLGNFGHKNLQSQNIDDALRARGASTPGDLKELYEIAGGFGGPFRQDKLWFFGSARRWSTSSYTQGNFFNKRQGTLFYEPDLSRPAFEENYYNESSLRLTWQAAAKHKITATGRGEYNCNCYFGIDAGDSAPETVGHHLYWPNWQTQVLWSYPATSRLLFQAGMTIVSSKFQYAISGDGDDDDIGVLDIARNYYYGSSFGDNVPNAYWGYSLPQNFNQTITANYITGSHALKVGFHHRYGPRDFNLHLNNDLSYTFRGANGVCIPGACTPQSVTYFASPLVYSAQQRTYAAFAQDQWTVKRLTISAGVRYDVFLAWVPEQVVPAGRYVPERRFEKVDDAINWKDLSPRLGAAYDLFGTGKTAAKVSLARYVVFQGNQALMNQVNPVNRMINNSTRTWTDNGDYIPQESELGPHSAASFGQLRPGTTYDDDFMHGFGVREFNWQTNASLQHELRPGLGLNVGYYRTWYGNLSVTDNRAVTPADYDPYCFTAPTDTRLPSSVSGQQICGTFDLNPSKFGQVNNYVTHISNYGERTEVFTGVDVTMNARFGGGGIITGGVSTGTTTLDTCDVTVDSPDKRFCRTSPPWSAGTQLKIAGVYPLPWLGLRASAVFQNVSGLPTAATFVVTNANARPSLGRPFSGAGNATRIVTIIEPNSVYEQGRDTQVDFRLAKSFEFQGSRRIEAQFDIFNAFNANSVLAMNARFGANWRTVSNVLKARLIKFGFQYRF